MPKLREYTELDTLLTYETSTRDPQGTADKMVAHISTYSPDFQILVLFVGPDPEHPWLLMPVPSEAIRDLPAAEISRTGDGRIPVAYWKRR